MNVTKTDLPGVLVLEPKVHGDARGYFAETYQAERYGDAGIPAAFVQDNVSFSRRGVLRGIHLQWPRAQGKLVQVVQGEVFDVAVDLRRDSPTFGRWVGHSLTGSSLRQIWIPPGFGHGFLTVSETALLAYKCTDLYSARDEIAVRWDDPDLAIAWPCKAPLLSAKDAAAPCLAQIDPEQLPRLRGREAGAELSHPDPAR